MDRDLLKEKIEASIELSILSWLSLGVAKMFALF